jgi:pimeloyl-ACP methyl ester carboxylesterase
MSYIEREVGGLNCAKTRADGPPLLMLHGVVRRWQTFLPLAPFLAERWNVCGLDLRGHGRSPHTPTYRVIDYADDVERLLRKLRAPAVVYGHSLGAMVALAVAARCPDRVRAIVMEDPPFHTMGSRLLSSPLHSLFAALAPFAGSQLPLPVMVRDLGAKEVLTPTGTANLRDLRDPIALRFTAAALQQMDPLVFEPILNGTWLENYFWSTILSAVECPALLLQADETRGGMLTDADAQHTVSAMRDCSLVKLPCGHVMHWEMTQKVAQLTTEFLECL